MQQQQQSCEHVTCDSLAVLGSSWTFCGTMVGEAVVLGFDATAAAGTTSDTGDTGDTASATATAATAAAAADVTHDGSTGSTAAASGTTAATRAATVASTTSDTTSDATGDTTAVMPPQQQAEQLSILADRLLQQSSAAAAAAASAKSAALAQSALKPQHFGVLWVHSGRIVGAFVEHADRSATGSERSAVCAIGRGQPRVKSTRQLRGASLQALLAGV
jgi:hypothetical protein